jgi:hypothetical protein
MPAHKSRLVRVMSEEQIVGITGTLPYATSIGRNWTGSKFTDTGFLDPRRPKNSGFRSWPSFFLTSIIRVGCGKRSAITR